MVYNDYIIIIVVWHMINCGDWVSYISKSTGRWRTGGLYYVSKVRVNGKKLECDSFGWSVVENFKKVEVYEGVIVHSLFNFLVTDNWYIKIGDLGRIIKLDTNDLSAPYLIEYIKGRSLMTQKVCKAVRVWSHMGDVGFGSNLDSSY